MENPQPNVIDTSTNISTNPNVVQQKDGLFGLTGLTGLSGLKKYAILIIIMIFIFVLLGTLLFLFKRVGSDKSSFKDKDDRKSDIDLTNMVDMLNKMQSFDE